MKWLKVIGLVLLGLFVLVGCTLLWAQLEFGSHPIIAHKRVTISLPYTQDVMHLIPMGETIEHPIPGGHPGIDFQWDQAVPIIAVADGVITSIKRADDKGEPVWYVTQKIGSYSATYKELESYTDGLKSGSTVKQGDTIGLPHCHTQEGHTGCQLHWEFAYASFFMPTLAGQPDRLCPLTYFDPDSLARITASWDEVPPTDRFKRDFPNICSNIYHDHNE